jgi:hypothetical protein
MSAKDALHPQQMRMFIEVNEIVDGFDKSDTYFSHTDTAPRDQWEKPAPETTLSNYEGEALRDRKLRNASARKSMVYDLDEGLAEHNLPPVDVGDSTDRPYLDNGHHRLAVFEQRKKKTGHEQYVPVRWHS